MRGIIQFLKLKFKNRAAFPAPGFYMLLLGTGLLGLGVLTRKWKR